MPAVASENLVAASRVIDVIVLTSSPERLHRVGGLGPIGGLVRALLVGLLAAAGAACSFQGDIGPGFRCDDGDRCPDGQVCVSGRCTTTTEIDADPDADPVTARCGTLTLLQDDFEDGVVARRWYPWSDPPAAPEESGGYAKVLLPAGSANVWAGFSSAARYDLTAGELDVEVAQVGGVDTVVEIRGYPDGSAQMVVEDGELIAAVYRLPGSGQRRAIPYVPADHRFWRLREDGGDLVWEMSGNRTTWAALHREPLPFGPEHVYAIVSGGGQLPTASEIRFADVNAAAPAGLRYCPTASLHDDFAAPPLEPLWSHWNDSTCQVTESGGDLTMTFTTGVGAAWCGVETRHLYDLRGSTATVDMRGLPTPQRFVTYFEVIKQRDDGTSLTMLLDEGRIYVEQVIGGATGSTQSWPYQAADHAFWRIAASGADVLFQTGPAAAGPWTTHHTTPAGFDLSEVQVGIGAGHYNPGPGSPVTVRIAAVNP
jgi:hypothetical protein